MAESIDGILIKIVWQGPSLTGNTRIIGKLINGQTIKGEMANPRENECYRLWGEYVPSRPPYPGMDFDFSSYQVVVEESATGVSQYLRRYVDGLGLVKSAAIVEHFGDETLAILRTTPERAAEVRGITPEVVEAIRTHFDSEAENDPVAESRLIEMFRGQKFPRSIVKKLLKVFRSAAPDKVLEKPYLLLGFRGVGWTLADSFATTTARYDPDGIDRHKAAIVEAFEVMARDGHTCGALEHVGRIACELLARPVVPDAWRSLAESGEVISYRPGEDGVRLLALAKFAHAEREIARRIARLTGSALPLPGMIDASGLADEQAEAVRLIEENGVAILTGGPGTGKSHTTAQVVGGLIAMGIPPEDIIYIAPTGKAARRGAELLDGRGISDVSCSTIHKALGPIPSKSEAGASKDDAKTGRAREAFGFSRNEASPLGAKIVIVDELSMCDIILMASLLRAIAPGSRVLFVGDENQLPSVGPGSVLRDLMAAGIPSFTLAEIRRSDQAGTVVHACHAIKDGRVPEPAGSIDLPNARNWIHLEVDDPQAIADQIVELHARARSFDPVWGMQVVTPQKARHPFATGPLNHRLAPLLNPVAAAAIAEAQSSDDPGGSFLPPFYRGDKVIRVENGLADELIDEAAYRAAGSAGESWAADPFRADWTFRGVAYSLKESAIVNGDLGTVLDVLDVPRVGRQVVVEFRAPTRLIRLPYSDAKLVQAYALTCHKMQGSGAPLVVVPVHHAVFWDAKKQVGLFSREWLYTAISRTQTLLITVGQFSAIRAAVGRKTVHLRRTRLAEMVREEIGDGPDGSSRGLVPAGSAVAEGFAR